MLGRTLFCSFYVFALLSNAANRCHWQWQYFCWVANKVSKRNRHKWQTKESLTRYYREIAHLGSVTFCESQNAIISGRCLEKFFISMKYRYMTSNSDAAGWKSILNWAWFCKPVINEKIKEKQMVKTTRRTTLRILSHNLGLRTESIQNW